MYCMSGTTLKNRQTENEVKRNSYTRYRRNTNKKLKGGNVRQLIYVKRNDIIWIL